MANIFSQMFSQFGPAPAQRADQGGGEYTGFIPEVYEGDDSSPNPIATTGNGMTVRDDKEAIRQRLLARERKQLENARLAEGNTQPGSGLVRPPQGGGGELSAGSGAPPLLSVLTGKKPVTVTDPDGSGIVTPTVATPQGNVQVGANEGVRTPQAGGSGGSILDSMFGPGNPIDRMVQAGGRSTAISDAVDRATNQGGANVIDDALTWAQTSPSVGAVLDPVFKHGTAALDKVSEVSGKTGFDNNIVSNWVSDAGAFNYGDADYSGMGKQLVTDAESIFSAIAGAVRDATGGMSMPTVVESDPARDAAKMGGSIQETAGALYSKLPQGVRSFGEQPVGNLLPTGAWDYFFNSIPGLDQRGQSGNTVTTPTDMSPTMEGQVGPPAEFETVDQQQARVDAASGPQVFDRRRIKPAWMKWFTPDRFENENIYDDMTEEERRANLLARIAAGDNSMVTTRPVRQ